MAHVRLQSDPRTRVRGRTDPTTPRRGPEPAHCTALPQLTRDAAGGADDL